MKFAALLLLGTCLYAADTLPAWAKDAIQKPVPAYSPKVAFVSLLNEESVNVDLEGTRTSRERGAIRVLQSTRSKVNAYRNYNAKTGRIREQAGWMVSPSGTVTAFGKESFVDVSTGGDIYEEQRARFLHGGSALPVGSVLVYEFVEEERTLMTQYPFQFQSSEPVLVSRFSITVPAGWDVKGRVFNRDGVEPTVAGTTYTWELRDLPWIEYEDFQPSFAAIAPRLAVRYHPTADNKAGLRALPDWSAVSGWVSEFMDPAAVVNAAIQAKADELTRGLTGELEKIRSIAKFVQKTGYISVQMNLSRGGGYTPNPADRILARNYGDCKDKSTLTRALLKAIGMDAYVAAIYWGDRDFVRKEWASPQQFNHAITAIRVSKDVTLPTVIDHPSLGRLLMFDPTAQWTPLGDLPESQQGSYALVLAGAKGELVQMPLLPIAANRVETTVEAMLHPDSRLEGKLVTNLYGEPASRMRGAHYEGQEALKKMFEVSFAYRVGGSSIQEVSGSDVFEQSRFDASVKFGANQFGKIMQGRLLVFDPGALVAIDGYSLPSRQRVLPIRLNARMRKDSVRIKVPEGFTIDELPESIELKSDYGSYRGKWVAQQGEVVMDQTIEIADVLAPATDYAKIRQFFDKVSAAQHSSVVLLKR